MKARDSSDGIATITADGYEIWPSVGRCGHKVLIKLCQII